MAKEQESKDRGHFCVLVVLGAVADHGPINLEQVADLAGISRTAAFRSQRSGCNADLDA